VELEHFRRPFGGEEKESPSLVMADGKLPSSIDIKAKGQRRGSVRRHCFLDGSTIDTNHFFSDNIMHQNPSIY
jgi:hypothetical protein